MLEIPQRTWSAVEQVVCEQAATDHMVNFNLKVSDLRITIVTMLMVTETAAAKKKTKTTPTQNKNGKKRCV